MTQPVAPMRNNRIGMKLYIIIALAFVCMDAAEDWWLDHHPVGAVDQSRGE